MVALSRFGHFATLTNMQSAALSVFPGIQSFSFVGATYASRYVTFTGVELYSNAVDSNGAYTRIATLTPAQSSLFDKYGSPGTTAGDPRRFPSSTWATWWWPRLRGSVRRSSPTCPNQP